MLKRGADTRQLVMMIAVIFIPFFAQNIQTLFAGQLLAGVYFFRQIQVTVLDAVAGIPWGTFQTLTTAVRALLTSRCPD